MESRRFFAFFPMPRAVVASLLLTVAVACGEEEPTFDLVGCRVTDAKRVAGDDAPLGFSAEDVVAAGALAGGYTLQFGWEKNPGPMVDLEIGIESANFSRVRWVREAYVIEGDFHPPCPQGLTFPAEMVVRTSDGQFDERLEVDLYATAADAHEWRVPEVPLEQLAGSYEPEPRPPPSERWDRVPSALSFHGSFNGAAGSHGRIILLEKLWKSTAFATSPVAFWGEEPDE